MAFSTTTAQRWQGVGTPQNSPAKGDVITSSLLQSSSSSLCLHAWPSRDAANFTRVPQNPWTRMVRACSHSVDSVLDSGCVCEGMLMALLMVVVLVKQIRTPDAYYATHDTMPPVQQGSKQYIHTSKPFCVCTLVG